MIIIQTALFSYKSISENFSQYYSILGNIIVFPIGVFIGIGFIHLMLKLFGGKAEFTKTIKFALSISIFPTIIYSLIAFIVMIISQLNQNYMASIISGILYLIFVIIFGIITIIIALKVYSIIHEISKWKVFFALFLIPMVFILIVVVVGIVGFQTWFNTYQSGIQAKVEQQSSTTGSALNVQMLTNGKLYIQNNGNQAIEVSSIKITDSSSSTCGGEKQYEITPGTAEYIFDTNSGEGCILEKGTLADVLIVASDRDYSFTQLIR